ncbi:MAG: cupin domain-containing protein [Hyphomonadaceae bacterium]|nr:cupin domain-containing protein [Hyphomonadaceae bacterium]
MQADEKAQGPVAFSMRDLPLLRTGMTTTPLACTDNLWLHGKVYSKGGENNLHAHAVEDHAFIVMRGAARFHFADGTMREAREFEGVLLPKGTIYRFDAVEGENLVMVRVGGAQIGADWSGQIVRGGPAETRRVVDPDGNLIASSARKGKTPAEPPTILDGRTVASDELA